MTALAILALADGAGPDAGWALARCVPALRPGDAVVVVETGLTRGTALALRQRVETDGWPGGVALRLVAAGQDGGHACGQAATRETPTPGVALMLGLSALAEPGLCPGPVHLLTLVPPACPDAEALAALRDRIAAAGGGTVALGAEGTDGGDALPLLRHLAVPLDRVLAWYRAQAIPATITSPPPPEPPPAAARRPWWAWRTPPPPPPRPAAPPPPVPVPGEIHLALTLMAGTGPRARAGLPQSMIPPGPEAGPWLLPDLAACMGDPGLAGALRPHLPALLRGAPAGARAAMAADCARLGIVLPPSPPAAAPARTGQARIRLLRAGRHAHRMPPAYPALAPLWADTAEEVRDPRQADLVLWAHPRDPAGMEAPLAAVLAQGRARAALLSEEPFWDTLFSPDPLAAEVTLPAAHLGEIRLPQVNHHRSAIFAGDRIPYLLLAEAGMIPALAARLVRNAGLSPAAWGRSLRRRRLAAAFMAERREEAFHDMVLPDGGIRGLCAWRTRLALACGQAMDGRPVARLGASWQGGPTRFALADWHGDKLAQLDLQARAISAVENTHQPAYLSEKLFDAFACGALPLYVAAPGHRVEGLGLPQESWLNLCGLDPAAAAARVAEAVERLPRDRAMLRAFAQAQGTLARLLTDAGAIAAERDRLGAALRATLTRLAG